MGPLKFVVMKCNLNSWVVSGLSLLDKTIQNQVSEHYEDLLKHATGIETLENVLSMMQNHIQVYCLL